MVTPFSWQLLTAWGFGWWIIAVWLCNIFNWPSDGTSTDSKHTQRLVFSKILPLNMRSIVFKRYLISFLLSAFVSCWLEDIICVHECINSNQGEFQDHRSEVRCSQGTHHLLADSTINQIDGLSLRRRGRSNWYCFMATDAITSSKGTVDRCSISLLHSHTIPLHL